MAYVLRADYGYRDGLDLATVEDADGGHDEDARRPPALALRHAAHATTPYCAAVAASQEVP